MKTLMELIDDYAESRHVNGDRSYNSKTSAARKLVEYALAEAGLTKVTFTWRDGQMVAVTRQNDEGQILDVLWSIGDERPSQS